MSNTNTTPRISKHFSVTERRLRSAADKKGLRDDNKLSGKSKAVIGYDVSFVTSDISNLPS